MTEASASGKSILLPTDCDAVATARRLIRGARFAALAVLEPGSGHPLASRVATAADIDGSPTMLISSLSSHTPALDADGRCSLLFGEPGKGDPLAHPRISVVGQASRLDRDTPDRDRVRRRYLARHPKAQLYVDFGDFAFFRIDMARASLNAGFGKAYSLARTHLVASLPDMMAFAAAEAGAVDHMNADHADAVQQYATKLAGAPAGQWRIASLDPEGLDLICGDQVIRLDFDTPLADAGALRPTLVAMAEKARGRV